MIPKYEEIMLPLLGFALYKEEHHIQEAYKYLEDYFNLTEEERNELLSSGAVFLTKNIAYIGYSKIYYGDDFKKCEKCCSQKHSLRYLRPDRKRYL